MTGDNRPGDNRPGDRGNPGTSANPATGEVPVVATRPRPRLRVPGRLFGGRFRTTTVAMCVAWLGLWVLYLYLNQDTDQAPAQPGAVVISETPYVPYVPPVEPLPSQTTAPVTTTTPTTTGSPTSVPTTTAPSVTTTAPTTTETPLFRLPTIPGIPGLEGGTDGGGTEPSGAPGQ